MDFTQLIKSPTRITISSQTQIESLSFETAMIYMNAMIIPHFTYCLTSWAQANKSTMKSLESLYKHTIKVLVQKPNSFHTCQILNTHRLLSWENLATYSNLCLVYKILLSTAPPPLKRFVMQRAGTHVTRGITRGDCIIPTRKSAFRQSAFSVTASKQWNLLPMLIREANTYRSFTGQLKNWLIHNQICAH